MIVEAENKLFKNIPSFVILMSLKTFVKLGFYGKVTGFWALGANLLFQSTKNGW